MVNKHPENQNVFRSRNLVPGEMPYANTINSTKSRNKSILWEQYYPWNTFE